MSDSSSSKELNKYIYVFAGSLFVILVSDAVLDSLAIWGLFNEDAANPLFKGIVISAYFLLFILMIYSVIPLFVRAFISAQNSIGNDELPAVKSLQANEKKIVCVIWGLISLALSIAIPAMLIDIYRNGNPFR